MDQEFTVQVAPTAGKQGSTRTAELVDGAIGSRPMSLMSTSLSVLVPVPGEGSINSALSACKASTLRRLLGEPRATYGSNCQPVTNPILKRRMVTKSVGPFRVTGLDTAVASLSRVMNAVKRHDPDAYAQIGTAGMLCVRHVRGSTKSVSNHSWGTAIDLTFGGRVDERGGGLCQLGLLRVYHYFHAEGWYWGAGFPTEDAMHFELADETVRKLCGGSGDMS